MNPKTEQDIRDHAIAEYPREACGLIVVVKGKERYLPCRNVAQGNDNFQVHHEDQAVAEDMGDIMALVHSHPNGSSLPSQADRVQMAMHDIPWYILSVNADGETSDLCRYEPEAYEAPLVGRHFAHGVLDCGTLIIDYYARHLDIIIPDFPREDDWWNKGQDLYMQHFAEAGFEPIKGAIREHDVILMQVRSPVANHAGVYIGDGLMLHHMYNRLSTRDVYGGWFQEVTRMVLRHRELKE